MNEKVKQISLSIINKFPYLETDNIEKAIKPIFLDRILEDDKTKKIELDYLWKTHLVKEGDLIVFTSHVENLLKKYLHSMIDFKLKIVWSNECKTCSKFCDEINCIIHKMNKCRKILYTVIAALFCIILGVLNHMFNFIKHISIPEYYSYIMLVASFGIIILCIWNLKFLKKIWKWLVGIGIIGKLVDWFISG